MTVTVGINGFGRMGRLGLRAGWGRPGLSFIQVNEISGDVACAAHLLTFDSVHGRFDRDCQALDGQLWVEAEALAFSANAAISDTDWSRCDIVIEATGKFRDPTQLQAYFDQGVKKVIVAAPVEGALDVVYGVNHQDYDPTRHHLLTAASCTTNCLAPLVKVMQERVGILHGSMTTIHDITNTQTLVDKGHKDLRRARSCGQSLIPTSTGSAKAITQIFPELAGKLNGLAVRVPLLNASLTDFVFEAARPVTAEAINGYFAEAAAGDLAGILGYENRPLVSVDYKDDPRSAIVDGLSTLVIDGTQVKILAWYDNEWGYANRLMDLAQWVSAQR